MYYENIEGGHGGAADNKQRELEDGIPTAKAVTKDVHLTLGEDGSVCVRNNGPTVPLTPLGKPPFEDVPTPAVVFGMLLSGTNFDDTCQQLDDLAAGFDGREV